jgi:small multidrug resistance family-3 protein
MRSSIETAGNAFVRQALLRHWRALLFVGIATLGLYSCLVNRSGLNLDFGRLMGCYIVAFFVVSQVLAALIFRDVPSARTLIGGALIIVGGITISS